jgi:tryptophanyl-tRNA synthetase
VRRKDPGNPEVCNIYTIHRAFSGNAMLIEIDKGCTSAGIGCIDCKKMLFENVKKELTPIREKAKDLEKNMGYVIDVLDRGAAACREIARATMEEVRGALGLYVPR